VSLPTAVTYNMQALKKSYNDKNDDKGNKNNNTTRYRERKQTRIY
jgi:hypothetical protein